MILALSEALLKLRRRRNAPQGRRPLLKRSGHSKRIFAGLSWVPILAIAISFFPSPAFAQTTFVDDSFTDTNATFLNAHTPDTGGAWYYWANPDDIEIQSNVIQPLGTTGNNYYYNAASPGGADYVVQAKGRYGTIGSNNKLWLFGRYTNTNNYYFGRIDGDGTATIVKRKSAANTTLDTGCTATIVTGQYDLFSLTIVGSTTVTLTLYQDLSPICSATDSSDTLTSAGYAGIGLRAVTAAGNMRANDFGASTLGATAVKLISFTAREYDGKVLLRWRTGYEVNNLGFHIYREENAQLTRLTPEPVAGSALLSGSDAMKAGRHYHWWDFPAVSPATAGSAVSLKYWLEDIDLNGTRTLHGPIEVDPSAISPAKAGSAVGSRRSAVGTQSSVLLSELGMRLEEQYREYWRVQEFRDKLSQKAPENSKPIVKLLDQTIKRYDRLKDLNERSIKIELPSDPDRWFQSFLVGRLAVKLLIKEEGWYRVTQPELVGAGLDPNVDPRKLKLFVDGREQAIRVIGEEDGCFDPEDAIEFYGVGLDTPSTDTRVYWLVEGLRSGKRVQVLNSRVHLPRSSVLGRRSFIRTVEKKDRSIYIASLKNGEEDNFFGSVITSAPVDQLLNISHVDPLPSGDAVLEVSLQGLTKAPHRVQVLFNEVEIGEIVFEDQSHVSTRFSLPQSSLLEGENLVTLVAQGGETDVTLVDDIRLTYWHTYTADEDTLRFTAKGGKELSIDGFSSSRIQIVDITNPKAVKKVVGIVKQEGADFAIEFRVPGQGQRALLAFTEEKVKEPAGIKAHQPSTRYRRGGRADLVIISHKDFMESLQPLKALREAQGWSVVLIDVEDLYDEFSFGNRSPQAIKDFLSHAKNQWLTKPRYVLLVGDASFDPRNFLGLGEYDFVPTGIIETSSMETASDDWFGTFDDEGKDGAAKMREMAIGRLPVRTAEEASLVVSKIVGYEQGPGGMKDVVLVADHTDPDGGFNFEEVSEGIGQLLSGQVGIKKIYRGQFGSDVQAREELLRSINEEPLVVNYAGHGSEGTWRGDVLTSDDDNLLTNGMKLPVVISMTCLNGIFHDVYAESLAEALLKAPQGGAVAVWASSGFTEPWGQTAMNKEMMRALFSGEPLTLGEAALKAKAEISDWDIRRTWILFGDPTTKLKN